MLIDRILTAIHEWIRQNFYRRGQRSLSFQPKILKRITRIKGKPINGQVALVERKSRRAIRTWIYMPHRGDTPRAKQYDIHLYLDTLEKLPNERNEPNGSSFTIQRSMANTHRVTILKTSHWCDRNGAFESEELFSGYFNFRSRHNANFHRWAIAALDDLALLLPYWNSRERDIDWDLEIRGSRQVAKN